MNKKLLAVLACIVILNSCKKDDNNNGGGSTSSGVQITGAVFLSSHTPGVKHSNYRLDSGVVAFPTAGTSLSFNYSNVSDTAKWSDTLLAPTNLTAFPAATYMVGFNQSTLGQNISLNRYYQATTSSWNILGDDYGALNVTVAQGSLAIAAQAVKATPVQTLANFPISYGDSIKQTSVSVLNATASATVPILGSITGPLTVTQTTTVNSKNFAWGTLKLKGYSDSMSVVVQKYSTDVKTDISSSNPTISALIPTILSQYGGTNGQTVTITTYRFWAKDKGLVMTLNSNGTANITTGL